MSEPSPEPVPPEAPVASVAAAIERFLGSLGIPVEGGDRPIHDEGKL
jgi:hypothetical protein